MHWLERIEELRSGNCPPERPCPKGESAKVQHWIDQGGLRKATPSRPRMAWYRLQLAVMTRFPRTSRTIGLALFILWRLGKFTVAMVRWGKSGFQYATAFEQERRRGICDPCQFRNQDDDSCSLCTCPLSNKQLARPKNWRERLWRWLMNLRPSKIELATEMCPKGFWEASA